MFTPSPIRVPYFTGSARIPPTARAAMSTTSSTGLRPFGNPALSPTRNPKRFWLAHRRRRNTSVQAQQGPRSVPHRSDRIPGKSEPCTAPAAADPTAARVEQGSPGWRIAAPDSGSRKNEANWLSFLGSSVLNLSFEPVPMISSLINELPSRFTCWNATMAAPGTRTAILLSADARVAP